MTTAAFVPHVEEVIDVCAKDPEALRQAVKFGTFRGQELPDYMVKAVEAATGTANGQPRDKAATAPSLPAGSQAGEVRNVGELLDDLIAVVRRFMVLPDQVDVLLAHYVLHTWAIDAAASTAYLLIVSPEKRSGKTRLLEVLAVLCRRAWMVTSPSEAAFYRKISQSQPTVLLDEIDALFGSATERTEPLRAAINAGIRRGATVPRCVGKGMSEVEDFEVFSAKVLAGIDTGARIPDTIRDRSFTITLVRKTAAESVERFRFREFTAATEELRASIEATMTFHLDTLDAADPEPIQELDDRKAEAAEPLQAIAALAGGDWPARLRSALIALVPDDDDDGEALGTLMLRKLRQVFNGRTAVATAEIVQEVNDDEQLPFGAFGKGTGLDGRGLARMLKPYGVRPRTVRTEHGTAKGYRAVDLAEAWDRYAPSSTLPAQASHPSHPSHVTNPTHETPVPERHVTAVTHVTANQEPADHVTDSSDTTEATPEEAAEAERLVSKYGKELDL